MRNTFFTPKGTFEISEAVHKRVQSLLSSEDTSTTKENLAKHKLSHKLIARTFGSVETFCKEYDLTPAAISRFWEDKERTQRKPLPERPESEPKYSEEEIIKELRRLYEEHGTITQHPILEESSIPLKQITKFKPLSVWRVTLEIPSKSTQEAWLITFSKFLREELNLELDYEVSFETCRSSRSGGYYRFDAQIKGTNILIEYQDPSHFNQMPHYTKDLEETLQRDKEKKLWALENNFTLIEVLYNEKPFSSIYLSTLKEKIVALLSNTERMSGTIVSITPELHNTRTHNYIGLSYYAPEDRYVAKINDLNGDKRKIFSAKDALKVAAYREGYIITHNLQHRNNLNNIPLEVPQAYNQKIKSYTDYHLLKEEKKTSFIGIRRVKVAPSTTYPEGWQYRGWISVNGKHKDICRASTELWCAKLRERYIIENNLSSKRNGFTEVEMEGVPQNWKDWKEKLEFEGREDVVSLKGILKR